MTGTRVGEACGLLWEAVDFESRTARIVKTVSWDHSSRKPILNDTTKTEESVRIIPLAEDLVEMLKAMKSEKSKPSDAVFCNRAGSLLRYNAIQSAFNAGFVALQLPWRSTHICRHTHATMMLLATKNLSAVQANLGHRSQKITERYAKAVAALQTTDADKTAALILRAS